MSRSSDQRGEQLTQERRTMMNRRIIKTCTLAMPVLALILSLNGTVQAQVGEDADSDRDRHSRAGGQHRGAYDIDRMLGMLTRRLQLDDVQTQQVSNIVDSAKPEFDLLREQTEANQLAMRALDVADDGYGTELQGLTRKKGELAATGIELFGRVRVEIHAILTPEQRQTFAASLDRQRGFGKSRRQHGRRGPSPTGGNDGQNNGNNL